MGDKRQQLIDRILEEHPDVETYDELPGIVKRNLESVIEGPAVEDPFAPLRRDG